MFLRVYRVYRLIFRQVVREKDRQAFQDSRFNNHMKAFIKENFVRCMANEDRAIQESDIPKLINLCGGSTLTYHQVYIAMKRAEHEGRYLSYKQFV